MRAVFLFPFLLAACAQPPVSVGDTSGVTAEVTGGIDDRGAGFWAGGEIVRVIDVDGARICTLVRTVEAWEQGWEDGGLVMDIDRPAWGEDDCSGVLDALTMSEAGQLTFVAGGKAAWSGEVLLAEDADSDWSSYAAGAASEGSIAWRRTFWLGEALQ